MPNAAVTIYNSSREPVADLQNAVKIGYEWRMNEIGRAWFSLPADDPKVSECTARRYAEIYDGDDRVGLFRLTQPIDTGRDSGGKFLRFEAEHVLATLIDDILFQYHEQGGTGVYTTDILDYILGEQVTENWVKGTCAFSRQFLYKWENENLLAALFSVPKPFPETYQWTWDTTSYPWTLNLIEAPSAVTSYIDYGRNLKGIKKTEDPGSLITRVYPLGFGEGINQLGINGIAAFTSGSVEFTEGETVTGASSGESGVVTSYNLEDGAWGDDDGVGALFLANLSGELTDGEDLNGSAGGNNMATYGIRSTGYIDADTQGTYGVISAPFVDRRYESAETLYHAAWSILQEHKTPRMTYAVEAAHIYQLTENSIDDFAIGGLVKVDDSDLEITVETRVKAITKSDLTGDPGNIGIALANKLTDIEGFQANFAYRQHINDVYAQGATNLDSHDYEDNCDGSNPALIRFFLPEETVHINKMLLSYKTEKFRAYATGAASGGSTTPTTSSGGATTSSSGGGQTTSNGGGFSESSASGGGFSESSAAGGGQTTSNGGGFSESSASGGGQTTSNGGGFSESSASGGGQTTSNGGGFSESSASGGGFSESSASGGGQTTSSGGGFSESSEAGGGFSESSASGGGSTPTSQSVAQGGSIPSGGGKTSGAEDQEYEYLGPFVTSSVLAHRHEYSYSRCPPEHTHGVPNHTHTFSGNYHSHTVSIPNHTHTVTIGNHTHTVTIGNHTHTVSDHTHTVTIGDHTHTVTIGDHTHTVEDHTHTVTIGDHTHTVEDHTHTVTISDHTHTVEDHTHTVTIGNHTHIVTVGNHTHTVANHTHTIGNHTHTVTIGNHVHDMVYGIYLKSPAPTGVTVTVDGNAIAGLGLNETNVNMVPYLSTDSGGKISRGAWHEVQITPNDLGRIVANVIEQFFVQSRGTGIY